MADRHGDRGIKPHGFAKHRARGRKPADAGEFGAEFGLRFAGDALLPFRAGGQQIESYMASMALEFDPLPGPLFLNLVKKAGTVFGEAFTNWIFDFIAISRNGLREKDLEKFLIVEDWIYYQVTGGDDTSLRYIYRMKTNGKEKKKTKNSIMKEVFVNLYCT